jgi:hypothetical protein
MGPISRPATPACRRTTPVHHYPANRNTNRARSNATRPVVPLSHTVHANEPKHRIRRQLLASQNRMSHLRVPVDATAIPDAVHIDGFNAHDSW